MQGEIDFKESLRRRVALLEDTPITVYETVRQKLEFQTGAKLLCSRLKRLGYKLAVVSGGFVPLARYVQAELGLDYAVANTVLLASDNLMIVGSFRGWECADGQSSW
jgi:phosphoserine phosphatase